MMMKNLRLKYIFPVLVLLMLLASCKEAGKNSAGSEYMPEMVHSIAYEANSYNYYARNTFSSEEAYYEFAQPRLPVKGTVARGNTISDNNPYYYGDSEEERLRATNEIIDNPYKISTSGLARGKQMYDIYCAICHGENGDSKGYLVRDDGGKFLALPANFMSDDLMSASNGRYYHAVMYGKNVMEPFNDKLGHRDRWEVIQYIRSLQAKKKGLAYNQLENTLNDTDKPAGKELAPAKEEDKAAEEMKTEEAKQEVHH